MYKNKPNERELLSFGYSVCACEGEMQHERNERYDNERRS